jgi:hypothetical protein
MQLPLGHARILLTPEGGYATALINRTGAASVKGSVVACSYLYENAFTLAPIDAADNIGVVYNSGIADGEYVWIVVSGRAQVLMTDNTSTEKGNWLGCSHTQAGRADSQETPPTGSQAIALHGTEVGHVIQAGVAGINQLIWAMFHQN